MLGMKTTDPYFSPLMLNRQLLSRSMATRLQLDRWEALVAENLRYELRGDHSPGTLIWQAQFEHHFCLVAAAHLLRALDMAGQPITVNATLAAEINEGRDLHEHWDENMPVFNLMPRTKAPSHKTGKSFAARNPRRGPYWWLGWDNTVGPKLLPNVPAAALYALLDDVESHVLHDDPDMARFILPRSESPWLGADWWPRPAN